MSDDYAVYRSWEHGRWTCLAHLIRAARGLSAGTKGQAPAGKSGAFVRRLDREFPDFLVVPAVGPTNNLAERSVRHGVVLRKTSLGTSSESGRRWIGRALSLHRTCRLRKRSFFEVMRDALVPCAAFRHRPWGGSSRIS